MGSSATTFIYTILQQFTRFLSPDKRRAVHIAFLLTLLDRVYLRDSSRFNAEDSLRTSLQKLLTVYNSELWDALKAALDSEPGRKLSVIIDGIDLLAEQEPEFVKGLRAFVEYLLKRRFKSKALLTCRSHTDVKEVFDGLLCIEYDKERQGSATDGFLNLTWVKLLTNVECLNTLRFDNTRYDKISEEHYGSLQWLWTHNKYEAWSSTDTSDVLLIEGKPGSGKRTLTKYFKRNLVKRKQRVGESVVASFFYSYREEELQTDHSNMLRSILYDVLMQNETFFLHFQPYYRERLQSGTPFRWPYDTLKKILLSFRNHPAEARLCFIIDAMDESDDTDRRNTLQLLRQLCSNNTSCKVKVFLASRPIAGLKHCVPGARVIKMQEENEQDILKFIGSFLGPELELPSEVLSLATNYIVTHAQGVFI